MQYILISKSNSYINVGWGFPKRAILVSWGAIVSKGAKGGVDSKILGVFISSFETYTRHFGFADEEQKKRSGCFT